MLGGRDRCGRCDRGCGGGRRCGGRTGLHHGWRAAGDADLPLAILHLDLGEMCFVEQFSELAHQRGIDLHRAQ